MLAYSLYLTRKNYCLSLTWSIECRFVFPLSLSLSLDSGEKSSDCLSAFHNPAMHFRFTDSSSIYIRNHSVQEDEENCMPTIPIPIAAAFLYILYRCCNIFWGSNYRTRYCFFAFAYVCILFAFCLHSVCIILHLFTAPIKQTTPEEHINATEAQHQAHNYGPVVPLRCLRKGWVWRPETSCWSSLREVAPMPQDLMKR